MEEGEVARIDIVIALVAESFRDLYVSEEELRAAAATVVIGNVRVIRKRIVSIRSAPKSNKQHELELFLNFAEHPPEDGKLMSPGIAPILERFASGKITLVEAETMLEHLQLEYEQIYKERGYFIMKTEVANG